MYKLIKVLFFVLILFSISVPEGALAEQQGIVIYAYHRIDEPSFPSSHLSFDDFSDHIRELKQGSYNVISLKQAVSALLNESNLPPRTIVLTFEGAHASILEKAVPFLLESNLPFTIFVSTDQVDGASSQYLSWEDLKKLNNNDLVDLGLQSASYQSLLAFDENQVEQFINRAKARFREKMGFVPDLFSYPFGETSTAIQSLVKKHGFTAAFGQQSGVSYTGMNMYNIPRFVMTENYGDLDRFLLTANALPLPVKDIIPVDPIIKSKKPLIGFTITEDDIDPRTISCFATSEGKTNKEILGKRVEIRLKEEITGERERINCTSPAGYSENGQQQWRWFGLLLSVVEKEESN